MQNDHEYHYDGNKPPATESSPSFRGVAVNSPGEVRRRGCHIAKTQSFFFSAATCFAGHKGALSRSCPGLGISRLHVKTSRGDWPAAVARLWKLTGLHNNTFDKTLNHVPASSHCLGPGPGPGPGPGSRQRRAQWTTVAPGLLDLPHFKKEQQPADAMTADEKKTTTATYIAVIMNLAHQIYKHAGLELLHLVTYPLFLVALQTDARSTRDWILARFQDLSAFGPNIGRAHAFLQMALKKQQETGEKINVRREMKASKLPVFVM
ncbi:hypothetical protein ARSEF1564_002161 [Beauveria bassiana]